jgi:hypothetical protein
MFGTRQRVLEFLVRFPSFWAVAAFGGKALPRGGEGK